MLLLSAGQFWIQKVNAGMKEKARKNTKKQKKDKIHIN